MGYLENLISNEISLKYYSNDSKTNEKALRLSNESFKGNSTTQPEISKEVVSQKKVKTEQQAINLRYQVNDAVVNFEIAKRMNFEAKLMKKQLLSSDKNNTTREKKEIIEDEQKNSFDETKNGYFLTLTDKQIDELNNQNESLKNLTIRKKYSPAENKGILVNLEF